MNKSTSHGLNLTIDLLNDFKHLYIHLENQKLLLSAFLGSLVDIRLEEKAVLVIKFTHGDLRVDLTEDDLKSLVEEKP